MKKYFVKETDEVIEFGEMVNVAFFKELEDGKVTIEKEVEFNEITMDLLIDMGFVEVREVEEEDLIDFEDDPCEALSALEEGLEVLEERVDNLEALVKGINNEVQKLVDALIEEANKKKNAQPKKK